MGLGIKTLLFYANGARRRNMLADTLVQGVLHITPERIATAKWLHRSSINELIGNRYLALSYVDDWIEAFRNCRDLNVDTCNIYNLIEYQHYRRRIASYDLIIISHAATGDNMRWLLQTASIFNQRRGKLIVFIGNEYDLMPAKIAFLKQTQADYVASQLPREAAMWLYEGCQHTQILLTPHALNPKLYSPTRPTNERAIDIGFRGDRYPLYIGDNERTKIIDFFAIHGVEFDLVIDVHYKKLPRHQWAAFLNSTKGIIGAEAGTYYLERDDQTNAAVSEYQRVHPEVAFGEIFEQFFKNYPIIRSGKAISSRHFEPIGTQTCQILIEGNYNNILIADQHYIAVRKDLSNAADAIERFNDVTYRESMVRQTYDYVMSEHTYAHRVQSIVQQVLAPQTASSVVRYISAPHTKRTSQEN